MAYNFATYGPFTFHLGKSTQYRTAVDELIADIELDRKGLSEAVGVYIIAAGGSGLVPWYVGKTDRTFRKRLHEHYKTFADLVVSAKSKDFSIFLLPRITDRTGKFKKATARPKSGLAAGKKSKFGLPSVERLETLLIGACLTVNENVKNSKKVSFHKELHVPGFINDEQSEQDASALALRGMLQQSS